MEPNPSIAASDPRSIDWSPHSFEDPGGRVFRKDGRIFRALRGRSAEAFLYIEKHGLMDELHQAGLVKTWRSDMQVEGYDVVVEHELLPPSPVVSEWTPSMLRDAAILFCDLSMALAKHNLQLQDCHGWNIMFHHCQPVYVDFSSIIPQEVNEPWALLGQFRACFLHPLQMIKRQNMDYAFFLLGRDNWVMLEDAVPRLFSKQHRLMRWFEDRRFKKLEQWERAGGAKNAAAIAKVLKSKIEQFTFTYPQTRWSGYAAGFPANEQEPVDPAPPKQKSVLSVLDSLSPGTLLDLGCNMGWYSILAARRKFQVISMDTDRVCLDRLYHFAKSEDLPITPVTASFFSPMISHGPRFYDPLTKRFSADHTLMLALAHHLFFKQGYDIKSIVSLASSITKKTLVLEHVPSDDYWIQQWKIPHRLEAYAMDRWIEALKQEFDEIELLPSEFSHASSKVQRTLIVARR